MCTEEKVTREHDKRKRRRDAEAWGPHRRPLWGCSRAEGTQEPQRLSPAKSRARSIPDRGNTLAKAMRCVLEVRGPVWLEASRIKGPEARDEDLETVRGQAIRSLQT